MWSQLQTMSPPPTGCYIQRHIKVKVLICCRRRIKTHLLWDNKVWWHNVVLLGRVLIDGCYSTRFSGVIFTALNLLSP